MATTKNNISKESVFIIDVIGTLNNMVCRLKIEVFKPKTRSATSIIPKVGLIPCETYKVQKIEITTNPRKRGCKTK